jgi:hypothetical protein
MNRPGLLRILLLSVAFATFALSPELAVAGGAHGGGFGGGGFHGGGGGGGGFHGGGGGGGGYHGGSYGGYRGVGYGGYRGGGYGGYRGGYGYGYRGGYGYGWRGGYGYGYRGGYGGWGWGGWGFGLSFNFGWPYWGWGYPYYSYYPSYYPYYPYGYGYYAPSAAPAAYPDPSAYGQTGSYSYPGPAGYGQPGGNYQQTGGAYQSGAAYQGAYQNVAPPVRPRNSVPQSAPSSSALTLHDAVYRPAPATPSSASATSYRSASAVRQRPEVQNVIRALRAMPPDARQRALDSGRYGNLSAEEMKVVREAAQLPPA